MALIVLTGNADEDHGGVVTAHVETRQIAPTILRFLGWNLTTCDLSASKARRRCPT
ncbi:MAG TPA: hypothetical protein VKV73_07220 [Chloroflexota bacterium]|nr:hypothetical protein [Chloroflexota bacterium]